MALTPVITNFYTSDCSTFAIYDVTGTYNNPNNLGGYGSPNTQLTQVGTTSAVITIYYPNGGTPFISNTIALFPTVANPSPYIVNEQYLLSPAQIGLNTTNIPDGIYSTVYSVYDSNASVTYTAATNQILVTCNVDCALANAETAYWANPMCIDFNNLWNAYMDVQSAKNAVACGKNAMALSMLQKAINILAGCGYGCGC